MRRRDVLRAGMGGLGVGAGWWLAGCAPMPGGPGTTVPEPTPPRFDYTPSAAYPQGVLSADPSTDSVWLWTRVDPALDRGDGLDVDLDVATDPSFAGASLLATLRLATDAGRDHTVAADVGGLPTGAVLWYRFRCRGATSPVGRTRTAPGPWDDRPVRIAGFSCQRWTHGWYTAHADLASLAGDPATDVDLVLSLGDYVYETGFADGVVVPGRDDPVQDAVTLEEFRTKYRLYRSDLNLQAVHAAYPMCGIFDNHDGGGSPTDPALPGAVAAFAEYWPVRATVPGSIERSFRWGRNAEVFLTDQRRFRTPQPRESGGQIGTCTWNEPGALSPSGTMLGAEQMDRLIAGITSSTARWKLYGSQLMFWPWRSLGRPFWEPRMSGCFLNFTQWDGYGFDRLRLLDALEATGTTNTVVVSGDSHVFSAASVSADVDDPERAPVLAELNAGSISSANADETGIPTSEATRPLLFGSNPHLGWFDSERHGYGLMEFGDAAMVAQFRSPRTVLRPTSGTDVLATFEVRDGEQRIRLR